ncbi:hypothetical protein ASG58_01325 [Rhizobium sp. Leaf383]|nr:hypothetical protein ASG58_01325 [Rhizobium sp. Leaf383]
MIVRLGKGGSIGRVAADLGQTEDSQKSNADIVGWLERVKGIEPSYSAWEASRTVKLFKAAFHSMSLQ